MEPMDILTLLFQLDFPNFAGDFVDRGSFSVECIFTLFGFKLLYPDHFFMSRGNHESENMNKVPSLFQRLHSVRCMHAVIGKFTNLHFGILKK